MKRVLTWLTILLVAGLIAYYYLGTKKMLEIKFDLGKNIVETAKGSGIPEFSVDNVNGSIFYEKNQIPDDIPARYIRPGYEITASPLFAFTLYADEKKNNNLAVSNVTLQFKSHLKTHEAGQAFVEKLIAQFQKGKWQRKIDETCPAVTGRSTFLDEAGNLNPERGCALDPNYKLTRDEWLQMFLTTQYYEWSGEGVLAELSVRYNSDSSGITYTIFLEFKDEITQEKLYAKKLADDVAAGKISVAEIVSDKVERKINNDLLEANAIKRGDTVIPR